MVLRTSRMRWFGHVERSTGWIAKVHKLNVVAQKRPGRPKKTCDEVLVDDRKKLGMDFADPMNRLEWRGRLRGRLVKQAQPSVEETGFNMDMMMMMMMMFFFCFFWGGGGGGLGWGRGMVIEETFECIEYNTGNV